MASTAPACSNAECRVATDGKCVEGYSLQECPHVGKMSVEDIDEVEAPTVPVAERPQLIALYTGEALDRRKTSTLQRRRISRSVAVIGPHDSGKTSLIASVFDLFQEGTVGNYNFAGSSTLIGFEKVCHHARASSRRRRPHTERTIVGADATFFHLDLSYAGDVGITALFIADRSGEDYLAAADDISRAEEFFELRRADTVTVLVNGEQLADAQQRHEVRAATPQLLGALIEAGAIGARQRIAMVLTKHDAVLASPHADRVKSDFDQMVDVVRHNHHGIVTEVERFVIAASPDSKEMVARGEGVDQLLAYWLRAGQPERVPSPNAPSPSRFFDLLAIDGSETTG